MTAMLFIFDCLCFSVTQEKPPKIRVDYCFDAAAETKLRIVVSAVLGFSQSRLSAVDFDVPSTRLSATGRTHRQSATPERLDASKSVDLLKRYV
jgi:hypothetical protein